MNIGPQRGPIVQDGDDPLIIGAGRFENGTISNFLRGAIDDFRIYSRALSDSEIAALGPSPEIHIHTQPQSYNISVGETVTLSVNASTRFHTNGLLSAQWQSNGVMLAGATQNFLSVTGMAGQPQSYRALLSASGGVQKLSDEALIRGILPEEGRLLLHLEFENNEGGRFVDSAQGWEGIVGNVALAPGRVGNSGALLDGSGYIRVPAANSALELVGTSYTIAWWMQRMSPVELSAAIPQRNFRQPIYTIGRSFPATGYSGEVRGGSLLSRQFVTEHRGPNPRLLGLTLGNETNWLHVAVVYTGSLRTLYTNGVAAGSVETIQSIRGSGKDDLLLGALSPEDAKRLGVVDDFRIYSYPLSSDEIAALADAADPVGPQNSFRIHLEGGEIVLSWPNIGFQYRVEAASTFGQNTSWTPLGNPVENAGSFFKIPDVPTQPRRFYRLRRL